MEITIDDYNVISIYAGADRSWHDRVSTEEAHQKQIAFSKRVVQMFLISARYQSKRASE